MLRSSIRNYVVTNHDSVVHIDNEDYLILSEVAKSNFHNEGWEF